MHLVPVPRAMTSPPTSSDTIPEPLLPFIMTTAASVFRRLTPVVSPETTSLYFSSLSFPILSANICDTSGPRSTNHGSCPVGISGILAPPPEILWTLSRYFSACSAAAAFAAFLEVPCPMKFHPLTVTVAVNSHKWEGPVTA